MSGGASLAREPRVELGVPPASGWLIANGLRLHYLDWGPAPRGPILFLHGAGLNAHTWDVVCAQLRGEYRCISLDLRGHGDSEWSPDGRYSFNDHASDVAGAVEQLGLGRFILVGMSLGGAVAFHYAELAGERLDALVVVESGPEPHQSGRDRLHQFMDLPTELDSVEDFVERALAFNPLRSAEGLRVSLLKNLRQTPAGKWTWKYDRRQMTSAPMEERLRQLARLWDVLPRLAMPVLVVRGSESDLHHDEDAQKVASALPRGRWVRIEGARHTVQGDRPVALTAEMRRFFAEVVPQ